MEIASNELKDMELMMAKIPHVDSNHLK